MERKIFDIGGHAHFVTFSCYKRRRVLDDHRAKGIVIHFLADQLRRAEGACLGFVIMPDHVHGLVHFKEAAMLSQFMQQWKRRSSIRLKEWMKEHLASYAAAIDLSEPVWQPRYYDFNVFSPEKANEKLDYMHNNPVKAGLVARAQDWRYGSAGWYLMKRPVGVEIAAFS
jgi:putative transposase